MTRFSGFPPRMQYTAVPNVFFSQLVPQIDDSDELKTTLFVLQAIYRKKGYPRFAAFGELAGNRALHLVSMGRSIYLVGAAESGISLIAEIKDQETLDQIRLETSQVLPPQGFAQFFQTLWKGGKSNLGGDSLDFMKQQRQRLKKM